MTIETATDAKPPANARPKGTVVPYLNLKDAGAASEFYQKAFGAQEVQRMPGQDGKRLIHCHLYLNDGSLMLSDFWPEHGFPYVAPAGYTITLMVKDIDAWFQRAVDAGCEVKMAIETMGRSLLRAFRPVRRPLGDQPGRGVASDHRTTASPGSWPQLGGNPMDPTEGNSKVMRWTGRVLWTIFVLFMIMDVSMKLLMQPMVETAGATLGLPKGSGLPIGIMELVILALYIWPRTAVLGVVLVTALMGGTAATHVIAGNPWGDHILFGVYLALIAWGGLWFRDPVLRGLLPLKRA